jgi:hypothetical protein
LDPENAAGTIASGLKKSGRRGVIKQAPAFAEVEEISKARMTCGRGKWSAEQKRQTIPSVSSWKFGIFAFSFDRPRLNPIKKDATKTVMIKTVLKNSLITNSSLCVFIFAELTEKVNKKSSVASIFV